MWHDSEAPRLVDDCLNRGRDMDHGRVEERQAFRFGATEDEGQLGAGEEERFDAFVLAHPLDAGDECAAGFG